MADFDLQLALALSISTNAEKESTNRETNGGGQNSLLEQFYHRVSRYGLLRSVFWLEMMFCTIHPPNLLRSLLVGWTKTISSMNL